MNERFLQLAMRLKKSYLTFRKYKYTETIKKFLRDKYIQSVAEVNDAQSVMILGFFGPGDEIRFASLYEKVAHRLSGKNVCFTCDPRLFGLLRRGHPELTFQPVKRIRSLFAVQDFSDYDHLPSAELHRVFDNTGWALAQRMDKVMLSTDMLGDFIENKNSFEGVSYLKADSASILRWQKRLAELHSDGLIVGISWRSSLVSSARNEHYFDVQQLAPVFGLPDILFVNLQYDECSEEVAWVEKKYPGKLIHFADLDQYNDLEETAALMKALDFIISPATTVIELAGALGCPALLLSNSSELYWRKQDGTDIDVWHHSVRHIEGDVPGNKESVICNLIERINSIQNTKIFDDNNNKYIEQNTIESQVVTTQWKNRSKNSVTKLDYLYKNNPIDLYNENNFSKTIQKYLGCSKSILDVGSGTGSLAVRLYDLGYDITCIDVSREMINVFTNNKGNRNIEIIYGDIFNYNDIKRYDAVVCRYVFPHYHEFSLLLDKLSHQVKSGGFIFFDSFSKDTLQTAATLLGMPYSELSEKVLCNIANFSEEELHKVCKQLNLSVVSRIPLHFFHRNTYFSLCYNNISDYDKELASFCKKDDVKQFLEWLQENCIGNTPNNISGVYLNVLQKH